MKILALALLTTTLAAQTPPAVTTRAYTNDRSGHQDHETILTRDAVAAKGIVRLTTIPVYGDARGMEAQPLIMPGVKLVDGSTHDVMLLPSLANVVRGVDAETGAGLWSVTLGVPVNSTPQTDFHSINQHFGCLSTGVIDPDTQRLYQVCQVSIDGSGNPASGRHFMFVLNVRDGSQVVPPIPVQGTDTSMWKQRSSLVMTTVNGVKTIFFAHGSVYESSTGYTGGITAFDVASNTVSAQLHMTSGIWMGGQGLVADPQGFLYAITGNGDFDPSKGFYGESFIKVQYNPELIDVPVAQPKGSHQKVSFSAPAILYVVDQWSPWTDYQRSGQKVPADKPAGESMPSESAKPVGSNMSMSLKGARLQATINDQGQPLVLVYPMASGAWSDEDWGSAGPACIFPLAVCVAAGKDGIGYPIHTTVLGGTSALSVGTAANYAKLAAPCAWLTMSPGPVPCDPADPKTLNFFPWGKTAHLHMTPVRFYDPVLKSWTILVWGENSPLHKEAVSPTGALTYVAQGNVFASAESTNAPGGMPGGFCSLSSNKGATAVLWCSVPYGDGNATITQGRLLAYDPLTLQVLWDSQRWGVGYTFNKFMPPTVWNGHVYLPNYSGGVEEFGLAN